MPQALKLYLHFTLRDLIKNWLRTALTIGGIALGVSVVLAISLANDTALDKFKETVNLISGKANLELSPTTSVFLDQKCLEDMRWLWQVNAKFTPLLQENVVLDDADKTLVQLVGIDMLSDADFKNYKESEATYAAGNIETDVLEPNAALVGGRLASDHHWKQGETFDLLVNEKKHRLRIAGILSNSGLGGAFSGNMIVVDLLTAQNALGAPGKISQVEIIAPEHEKQQIAATLQAQVPSGSKLQSPAQRGAQVEKMTRSFEYNLLALTFIALLVGMFLIYNTMTISVIRRRSEIGTLRALGVSRRGILALFAIESLTFGILGSGAGVALGVAFSQGALGAIANTFQHFYFKQPLEQVVYNPTILILAFALGVAATIVASLAPAVEAANVAPAEAARRASYESKATRSAWHLFVWSILALIAGAASCLAPPIFNFPVFGYLTALLWILGCSLSLPIILKLFLPVVARICQNLAQSEGRWAARCLEGALGRTSVASASLMVGIAMMVSLAIMIGSFRQTVMLWVDETLKADLWVQPEARANGSELARMQESTVDAIRSIPGVVAIDTFVEYRIDYQGEPTNLAAGDFDVVGKYGHLIFTSGEQNSAVCARIGDADCMISETFAIRKNIKQGDTLTLDTPRGKLPVKVQGIYYDYASDLGFIVIPRPVFTRYFNDTTLSSCAIYLKPEADPASVRAAIFGKLKDRHLFIRTTRELRTEALRVFNRTFSITYALHTIAIIVAMLAVTNSLLALTLESKRDFAIMRYLGASASQLRKVVLIQAALLGTIGNVGGIILGFLLSLLLIFVINRQSFGWTVQMSVPMVFLIQSSFLVLGAALLAGLWPARLAAVTSTPSAVREE